MNNNEKVDQYFEEVYRYFEEELPLILADLPLGEKGKKVGIYGMMESNKFKGVETMKNKNLKDEIKEVLFLLGFSTIVGTEYLNDAVEIAILSL